MSATVAIPQLRAKTESANNRKVWRVLFDSGSDGDIAFLKKSERSSIDMHNRLHPQKWKTSNGIFETNKVGHVQLTLPKFSTSKVFSVRPDIQFISEDAPLPMYDLIVGLETLANWKAILNFDDLSVTIDHVKLPMQQLQDLGNPKVLQNLYRESTEPSVSRVATNRVTQILDAKYEKANLPNIVNDNCKHLNAQQRNDLLRLLLQHEELFDGTLGEWRGEAVNFQLQLGAKPFHGRPFPIPHVHKDTIKKEVARLVEIGVLKPVQESEWAFPSFIIPKKSKDPDKAGTVRFLSDLRELNKRVIRKPYPLPKISTVLQELEGFQYATALDLNMGYYTLRLDLSTSDMCTIIFPWGKYSYQRLPMGASNAPDIFQAKMGSLFQDLEFVRAYLDDLLIISSSTFEDHLDKLGKVLQRLQDKGLRINAPKSTFATDEIEYLGYTLTRQGIKPQTEKVSAILALQPPTNVKQLRRVLGIVQYYRDIWEKRTELLAPLTDLVGHCGTTKSTKKKGTIKAPWHWDDIHQKAFESIKDLIARDVILAYPDYSQKFVIYTDASQRQLGAVITQNNRPIAFFSRKLNSAQQKYSITELELLSIVETLKEFKGMLFGQKIEVFTDHINLTRDALGMTSDRVYRWRLLIEEYGPEIIYIKGVDNTVADAISRLDYNPALNRHADDEDNPEVREVSKWNNFITLFNHYDTKSSDQATPDYMQSYSHVFATNLSDDEIYPLTVSEIADAQRADPTWKKLFKEERSKSGIRKVIIDETEVLVFEKSRLVIPSVLRSRALQWYHHYLQHPGTSRLEETLIAVMYWPGLRADVKRLVKSCERCQKGKRRKQQYGHVPPKLSDQKPWRKVCVDLIGPYTIKGLDGTIMDFMCLTIIDPATGWFEMIELPVRSKMVDTDGKVTRKLVIDKSSAEVARLFNRQWLSRYPRAKYITYDNGSEFKLHFEELCDSFGLERKPTTVKNPQANAIIERVHGVLGDMMRTSNLDMSETVNDEMIEDFLVNAAWAIRSTYHTVLKSTPGAAIFGRDMLFDIPYVADWNVIGRRRQEQVEINNKRENKRRQPHDYAIGDKVLIRKDGILRKAEDKYEGPYTIIQVYCNGTLRIQRGSISERLNIRRLTPYIEES